MRVFLSAAATRARERPGARQAPLASVIPRDSEYIVWGTMGCEDGGVMGMTEMEQGGCMRHGAYTQDVASVGGKCIVR